MAIVIENAPKHEVAMRVVECVNFDCAVEGMIERTRMTRATIGVTTALKITREIREGCVIMLVAMENDILS